MLVVKIKPAGVRNGPSIFLCDFQVNTDYTDQRGVATADIPHVMPVIDPMLKGIAFIGFVFYLLCFWLKGGQCDLHKMIETLDQIAQIAQI